MQIVFLLIDVFLYTLVLCVGVYVIYVLKTPPLRDSWSSAFKRPVSVASGMVLLCFLLIALLDSIHLRPQVQSSEGAVKQLESSKAQATAPLQAAVPTSPSKSSSSNASAEPKSILDLMLKPLEQARERSYSAPLAIVGFKKETFERDGVPTRDYPRLKFGGLHLGKNIQDHWSDCWSLSLNALWKALAYTFSICASILLLSLTKPSVRAQGLKSLMRQFARGDMAWPARTAVLTLFLITFAVVWTVDLSAFYHVLGTDQTGKSVLLIALKSIRTALVIGTLTTLVIMPVALSLGIIAGYFRGAVDEFIQYIYTLLASVPDVLLIAATVLMLQVFIDSHSGYFDSALQRSDARLFFLCVILALTSFTGLCRLVRGETLKLRELEYVQSAKAFGVSTPRMLLLHIAPNLMHLVLINCVMQFSGFILSEAVLSYVGVGVDPNTASFGVMINTARDELAATPVVWWTLVTAFVFMFLLVISANLLADAVRDAFDPKTRLSSGRTP